MKITIHISHTDADDLDSVQAAARALGLDFAVGGGFMGKQHAEITTDMSPAEVEAMLAGLNGRSAIAA